jgi:hypothetical protein
MKQFEVLISRYVREDQTLLISAPSEEEFQNKMHMLKDIVSERFEDKWAQDFDGTPNVEVFSVEELELEKYVSEDGTTTFEYDYTYDDMDIQWEELCRKPDSDSNTYTWR